MMHVLAPYVGRANAGIEGLKDDGLIKKTISFTIFGERWGVVAYYTLNDALFAALPRPRSDPAIRKALATIGLSSQFWAQPHQASKPRAVEMIDDLDVRGTSARWDSWCRRAVPVEAAMFARQAGHEPAAALPLGLLAAPGPEPVRAPILPVPFEGPFGFPDPGPAPVFPAPAPADFAPAPVVPAPVASVAPASPAPVPLSPSVCFDPAFDPAAFAPAALAPSPVAPPVVLDFGMDDWLPDLSAVADEMERCGKLPPLSAAAAPVGIPDFVPVPALAGASPLFFSSSPVEDPVFFAAPAANAGLALPAGLAPSSRLASPGKDAFMGEPVAVVEDAAAVVSGAAEGDSGFFVDWVDLGLDDDEEMMGM